jgi:two-component system, OmpR family, phosphate regulon sensor histidine kinase PhoR
MAANLFKRSLATLSAAVLAAALVFAIVGSSVMAGTYAEANAVSLARAAGALAAAFPPGALGDPVAATAFARQAASSGYRVSLIAADGRVVADSEANPATMENHRSRPEVAAALAGRASSSRRKSSTVGEELAYAAAPIPAGSGGDRPIQGAIRLALHVPSLDRALAPSRWTFLVAAAAFALAALAAAAAFSRMTAKPLAALAAAARSYGSGAAAAPDSGARAIRPEDPEELRVLALTLDSMAAEIEARVAAAEAQGRELEAILDAMAEAVIALDSKLAVTIANPAAEALFAREGKLSGRGLLEATRSTALQEAAAACLATGERRAIETALYLPSERFFRALAAPLKAASRRDGGRELEAEGSEPKGDPAPAGVVLVLGDITELRRLERVRRDFVANVSHELRTPVQLVKGFAETLRSEYFGAEPLREGPPADPAQGERFLDIIERNAERMESLISDLLSLASLEREDRDRLAAEVRAVRPVLESAREAILPKAEARGTTVLIECPEGLAARLDESLLEQALVNLVDNAIKYSPPGKEVSLSARAEGPSLVIEVRDRGIGIPARDLPRIFERFYRVDKARSRELGGTGLGLAIVRHIAIAHGGDVSVESWEGEGSTFRMRLPLNA